MDGTADLSSWYGTNMMGPAPQVTPGGGGPDWNLIAMMLGGGAQAFAPPGTWQHGVGGLAAGLGQSRKFAEAATKARAGERGNWEWLRSILSGTPTPQGMEGITSMKVGKAGEGKLPEVTLGLTPPRDVYEDIFGTEPITLSGMEAAGGAPESLQPFGGAGRPSATAPFTRPSPRPTDLLPPI